jgi:hypothetical protein
MVNKSTNFIKANNYLSTQIIEHTKNMTCLWQRNPDPGLGQTQKHGGVKLVHEIQPLPLDVHILMDLNRLMVDIVNLSLNAL